MRGIDISNNNGNLDFNKVKNDGIECCYIKATEGKTFIDNYLNKNYDGCKKAGIKTGFYHFLVGTSLPEDQAISFYNQIKGKTNDLIPMLDIEIYFSNLINYATRFIKKFKELSNLPIGVYTYTGFMNNLGSKLAEYPLWEANYNGKPWNLPNNGFNNRIGHQYSSVGRINGIHSDVDLNEFNEGVLVEQLGDGYIVTNYLPDGYRGDGSFVGVDMEYVLSYFKGVRCYNKSDSRGIWIETQVLSMAKCRELQKTLGSWFYEIRK